MIFITKTFFRIWLVFSLGAKIPQKAFDVTASFFDWLKLTLCGSEFHKFFLSEKHRTVFVRLILNDHASHQVLRKILEFYHGSWFTPDHKQSKRLTILDLCLNSINFDKCSVAADTSEANFNDNWVSLVKTHYEARMYCTEKTLIVY